jgi:hypothetical protein
MSKTNKISNPEIEKYYFEEFKNIYPLPSGNVIYTDSPDIIIDGPRKIGVEVTNFYLEKGYSKRSEQAQRRLREKVISSAQQDYQNGNGKKIKISFSFNITHPIQKKKKLIKKLVELARKIEKRNSGEVDMAVYSHIPELSFVYINANEDIDNRWGVSQVYGGQVMSRERLIEIVRAKEKQAIKYKKCDTYWLLVVVDSIDRAQDQEIRFDGFNKIHTEIFEKIFIYRTIWDHILEAK